MRKEKEYIVIETDLANYYGDVRFCKYWSDKKEGYGCQIFRILL